MISAVTAVSASDFLYICDCDMVFGPQIKTWFQIYGIGSLYADFWLVYGENLVPNIAVGRLHGKILLAGAATCDSSELRDFLAVLDWKCLQGEAKLLKSLRISQKIFSAPAMWYTKNFGSSTAGQVTEVLAQSDVYRVLERCFPNFSNAREEWYVHVSHVTRHNLGFMAGVYAGQTLISTAGVYEANLKAGVISCVATLPEYRQRGYGGQVVAYAADRLITMRKIPILHCADSSLERYYAGLGFASFADWAEILR